MKPVETVAPAGRGTRSLHWLAGSALALGFALGGPVARAGDVYWSLGMQTPGVVLGASNAAPVYVAPAPVVVYPSPAVVYPAPRVVAPPPVYGVGWMPPGHFRHHKHHWHGDGRYDGWRGEYRDGGPRGPWPQEERHGPGWR